MTNNNKWIIKTLVPEEIYTDREEFLEYFYNEALKAATRRTMSTVLLGQRRMGKTEIFKRVVNRLFFEQDPKNLNAVVPVYYSFSDTQMDNRDFAKKYLENFIRHYVGFYTGNPKLVMDNWEGEKLITRMKESRNLYPFRRTFDLILEWYNSFVRGYSVIPQQTALEIPRRVSDIDDTTIVMFLDEFQNTKLPQYKFDIVGFMQEAVESPTCPHFVTGSAMSILAREIIGRGSLFGRFYGKEIEPLTNYWGAELALKSSVYYQIEVSEVMAPVIADRCGGNPFYITAVVHQAAQMGKGIYNEEVLNEILAVDLSSGFIWGELNDQVTRWINRINEHNITKWILYLSAMDENTEEEKRGRLNIERIQQELRRREGKDIPLDMIRDVLIKLSRGDLVEYLELGGWFRRVNDPILLEFLKVWGRIEVEGHNSRQVRNELRNHYQKLERQIREYKGYLAEIYMSQILLSSQNKVLPGVFFNTRKDVEIPWLFSYVRHRVRLGSGSGREIDVLAAAGNETWICQSKWITGKKIGTEVLNELMSQADTVREEIKSEVVRMWLFAHDGLTREAKAFAKKNGILWSSRKEFDELLKYMGLRELPQL